MYAVPSVSAAVRKGALANRIRHSNSGSEHGYYTVLKARYLQPDRFSVYRRRTCFLPARRSLFIN